MVYGSDGEDDAHRRAAARLGPELHMSLGLLHESVNLTKAQPRSLPHGLRGVERLEGPLRRRGIHAEAGIGHFDHDMGARSEIGRPMRFGEGDEARRDGEPAAFGHGVARVVSRPPSGMASRALTVRLSST